MALGCSVHPGGAPRPLRAQWQHVALPPAAPTRSFGAFQLSRTGANSPSWPSGAWSATSYSPHREQGGCLWVPLGASGWPLASRPLPIAGRARFGSGLLWVAHLEELPSRLALAKVTARGAPARSQSRLFDGFVSVPGTTVAAAARPRRAHALHARRPGGAHLVVRRGVGDHPERSAVDAGQAI